MTASRIRALATGAFDPRAAFRTGVAGLVAIGSIAVAEAAPLPAGPVDQDDATASITTTDAPTVPAPLHRLGAGARQLRLSGETDARDYPVFLTAREARAPAHLHLATTNAVSVMAEASRMRVLVNDVPVSDTPIASPTVENPGVLDIDLPASLLEPGYNAVRIEVQERHRVDCSLAATYELWTQIDPATAGFTFTGLAAAPLGDIADLPALPPAEDGATPLRLVVPKGTDGAGLDRLFKAAEAVAVRGRFAHPTVEVATAPVEEPGLDIVAGTAEDLKAGGLGDLLPDDGSPVVLRPGTMPGHNILVLSAEAQADVDAAVTSLPPAAGEAPNGTPAGLRAIALSAGRPVEGGSVVTLRDLGVPSQEFSGRLFRTGFDILLPPDFYAADYDKMTLRVDAAYAPGLVRGSQMLVRVNGRDAAALPFADRGGEAFRGRVANVPLTQLRPGLNHIEIEAQLATEGDKACDAAATMANKKRFVLLDSSSLSLPAIARIAQMPNLAATAASGFPYVGRKTPGQLVLPHPDADAISAAATVLSRMALAAGAPLDMRLILGGTVAPRGSALVIGAFADLPPALIDGAGLDAAAMKAAWSHVGARSVASARLREAHAPAGRSPAGRSPAPNDLALVNDRDGSTLFRRWSEDVSAGQWRLDPSRLIERFLEKAAGLGVDNLPRWGRREDPVAVSPDMRLVVAQHEAPGGHGDTWTVVSAPTGGTLRGAVRDLTAPDIWNQLDGRVATLDTHTADLTTLRPRTDYFVATAGLSPGNLRLIAAGWLSSDIEVYVLCFVLLAIALGAATAAAVKHYGVKP